MSNSATRAITFEPIELSFKNLNQNGIPANILQTDSIKLAVDSFTGYARMHVCETGSSGVRTVVAQNDLFYWFFESRDSVLWNAPQKPRPLIIWLNGGPGSSSLAGLFMENGPLKLGDDDTASITENPFGWNKNCHLLYWDQPAGTGFSYTTSDAGYMNSEDELSREFCTALELFFGSELFKKYRDCPLYLAGESYAGKYIPNIACELMMNKASYPSVPALCGTAIGDGWMLPGMQTRVQVEYGFEMGFVDTRQYLDLLGQCYTLQEQINTGNYVEANKTGTSIMEQLLSCGGDPNIYDVRTFTGLSTTLLGAYLNSNGVRQAVGAECEWQCADNGGPVADHLEADVYAPADKKITQLLEYAKAGALKVLFYTGNFDMSCGFRGTEEMLWNYDFPNIGHADLSRLELRHDAKSSSDEKSWRNLDRMVWVMPPNKTLGFVKSLGKLAQVVIVNSGHLAPMNRPKAARSMISNWIFDLPFPTQRPDIHERESPVLRSEQTTSRKEAAPETAMAD